MFESLETRAWWHPCPHSCHHKFLNPRIPYTPVHSTHVHSSRVSLFFKCLWDTGTVNDNLSSFHYVVTHLNLQLICPILKIFKKLLIFLSKYPKNQDQYGKYGGMQSSPYIGEIYKNQWILTIFTGSLQNFCRDPLQISNLWNILRIFSPIPTKFEWIDILIPLQIFIITVGSNQYQYLLLLLL